MTYLEQYKAVPEDLAAQIRSGVLKEIKRRNLTTEQLTKIFGLLPVGVEILLQKKRWSLEAAVSAAAAVGLRVGVYFDVRGAMGSVDACPMCGMI